MSSKETKQTTGFELTTVITNAIKIPGVKVVRESFLREQFKDESTERLNQILEKGPVVAGCSQAMLQKKASRIIRERTAISTGASFLAGIPGGLAMAATIPADMLQYYGIALRMAQELVYLYGEADLWCDGTPDADKVTSQLVIYCGVMLGVSGAAQAMRLMSSALAKQAMKKLPQMALTKTFYYPIVKSIVKFFGVSMTKSTFAKGVSKFIPVIGGVVSGGLTLASMPPMGKRLAETLDHAHFTYTQADFEADLEEANEVRAEILDDEDIVIEEVAVENESQERTAYEVQTNETTVAPTTEDPIEKIKKAKELYDSGILTEEEFNALKARLLSQL